MRFAGLERGDGGPLCSEHDIVYLALPRTEFARDWKRASDVRCVEGRFATRIYDHHVTGLRCPGIIGVMQHRRVDTRADDRRVSRTLATALAPLILQQGRKFALRDAGLYRLHSGKMRGDRSVSRFADQIDFALVFVGSERGDE